MDTVKAVGHVARFIPTAEDAITRVRHQLGVLLRQRDQLRQRSRSSEEEADLEELERSIEELRASAEKLESDVQELRKIQRSLEVPEDLMTTGEAASALGVRSVNTVKRWAKEGRLVGAKIGNRILVSRASVVQMLNNSVLNQQKTWDADLEADLEPFDFSDMELPDTPWPGRKPWETKRDGPAGSPST